MQEELRSLQPQLVDTSAETESLMVKIEQDTVKVEAQKEIIAADESLASDLAEATPALDAAISALDTLKSCRYYASQVNATSAFHSQTGNISIM